MVEIKHMAGKVLFTSKKATVREAVGHSGDTGRGGCINPPVIWQPDYAG